MSWDAKTPGGKRAYYYRSVRRGDRICKVYLGRGPEAEEAARQIEERRQVRQAQREALHEELLRVGVAEQHLRELHDVTYLLVSAALTGAGYYRRRSEWRKLQHGGDNYHGTGV